MDFRGGNEPGSKSEYTVIILELIKLTIQYFHQYK